MATKMPYNTRRKSLSLPSLGIHVPVTHASRSAAHRASPSNAGASSPSDPSSAQHPNKKIKRSHNESRSPSLSKKNQPSRTEPTPPASPTADHPSLDSDASDAPVIKKIDLEGINDEIVEAVIVQLQNTGNRPHLVKELSAILMQQLRIVQQSANPCAIISSRLATYLKRSCWSALSPCPLAKELETVHPRRTYFYLTTCPHQPLPDPSMSQFISRAIVTPPLSSTNSTSEDAEEERRRELSPSPEVDLSSPEFDDMDDDIPMPSTPIGSFSGRFPRHGAVPRHQRGASPPLEKDEKEFTQTAEGLQKRKLSSDKPAAEAAYHTMDLDDGARDDSNLFGGETKMLSAGALTQVPLIASPAMRPTFTFTVRKDDADSWSKFDSMLEWDRSPENIELEELDGLLNGF